MKLFVSGDQKDTFIRETLEDIDDAYGIEEICGSASSRCMDTIVPWAEHRGVPISLHFPTDTDPQTIMICNMKILDIEKPEVMFLYDEDKVVRDHLIESAANSSVEFIIREKL